MCVCVVVVVVVVFPAIAVLMHAFCLFLESKPQPNMDSYIPSASLYE